MKIIAASRQWRDKISQLLQSQNLPTEDLSSELRDFYVALEEEKLVGLIGMERYNEAALLRSMVVHPDYRNRQIAGALVQQLETTAKASGIEEMYLLTETAENYFYRKGYVTISREDVPEAVKRSAEFSHVCPLSATVMCKQLSEKIVPIPS